MARGYPDFEGDKSGLYLKPEWSAKEARDKNFGLTMANKASGEYVAGSYAVPAGKTLYITGLSFSINGTEAEDRDNNQVGEAVLLLFAGLLTRAILGGNGGGGIALSKPIVFEAEDVMYILLYNYANHNCGGYLTLWGYEV